MAMNPTTIIIPARFIRHPPYFLLMFAVLTIFPNPEIRPPPRGVIHRALTGMQRHTLNSKGYKGLKRHKNENGAIRPEPEYG
jgi:hypothetical protein